MNQLAQLLADVLTSPYTAAVIAALVAYAVPNKLLLKIPVVGEMLQFLLEQYAKSRVLAKADVDAAIQTEATRLVQAAEQLIKNGTLDASTAKAQTVGSLLQHFAVTPNRAAQFIESAVHELPTGGLELISYSVPLTDPAKLN